MNRVLVIGLDGGTRTITYLEDAGLPHLRQLELDGAHAVLESTTPPITSAAWASMLTGWNPGRHGMYDFRRLSTDRYARLWGAGQSAAFADKPEFMTSARWRGGAVWDILGDSRDVSVSGVPMTYPPWPVNGAMISGFPLPDYGTNHSNPPTAGTSSPPLLERTDELGDMDDETLAEHCQLLIDRQVEVVRGWLSEDGPEFMMAVFQPTDFAQHRLWKYLDQVGHPLRDGLLEMYRSVDQLVGEARERLGDSATVAVVSDHGFGPHPTEFVHTDSVLQRHGILHAAKSGGGGVGGRAKSFVQRSPRLKRKLRLALDRGPRAFSERAAAEYTSAASVDWSRTRAFRYPLYAPAEGIVINVRGRQPEGCVEPGAAYEAVRDEVIAALTALRDPDGNQVVRWARRREEIYSGEYLDDAPDVVALFVPSFKAASGREALFSRIPPATLDQYSGVHAMEGIFAIAGHGIAPGVDLGLRQITDVAPTLLSLMGVTPPADLDGTPMEPALVSTELSSVSYGKDAEPEDWSMTAEEEATLERSLKALGYLE